MRLKHWRAAAIFAASIITLGMSACNGQTAEEREHPAAETTVLEQGTGSEETDSEAIGSGETGGGETEAGETLDGEAAAPVLKDGVYPIQVDSSSDMFRITQCQLTVKDGTMTARMTMGGTGYLKVFMGTGEEAEQASEEDYIPFTEQPDGTHAFQVPVAALDQEIPCSAFSKRREKWYDRTLVFRSDSLPAEAFSEESLVTAESLGLADGSYRAEVKLEGGSGRTFVESPALLQVENGSVRATVVWSSSNYDYMVVDGNRYDPVNDEGNSTFEIPVPFFDKSIGITADTVAMSVPHEIEYTLIFDSSTLEAVP